MRTLVAETGIQLVLRGRIGHLAYAAALLATYVEKVTDLNDARAAVLPPPGPDMDV